MASDEPARPTPVVLRIKLRYDDVETMVQKFAPNVGKAGLFLPTKAIQPIGTEVKFELRLSNETPVIVGLGRVKVARDPDPTNPKATFGIGIELMRVTRESRDLILKMLERRRQLGLVEVPVPMPDDIDAARRADVDTGVKQVASVIPIPPPPPPSESLLTAPRRQSGPIAIAKLADQVERSREVVPVAALAPEPSRRHVRRPVGELIASVTGMTSAPITADMFGGEDEVDVKSVLARARQLAAGTDLDAELDALRDSMAAPLEISIEAASAELARQLGGKAVDRKNRSAPGTRWAVPPPSAPAPAVTEIDVAPPDHVDDIATGTKNAAAALIAALAPERAANGAAKPSEAAAPPVEPVIEALAPVAEPEPGDGGEIHDVDETDVEEVDPRAGYFRDDEPSDVPAHRMDEAVAAASLEAMAVEAEEADEDSHFVPAGAEQIVTEPRQEALPGARASLLIDDDVDPAAFDSAGDTHVPSGDDEAHAEFDLDSVVDRTQLGADSPLEPDAEAFDRHAFQTDPAVHAATADRIDEQLAAAEAEPDSDDDFGFSDPVEEIDDFEILAEADLDESDLLLSDVGPGTATNLRPRTSDDFVARLDLTNEFAAAPDDPLAGFRDSVPAFPAYEAPIDPLAGFSDESSVEADPRFAAHGNAKDGGPGTPATWDPITGSYTYATTPRDLIEAHGFDETDIPSPIGRGPYVRTGKTPPPESFDLENALEALDVDLDELAIPPEPAHRPSRTPSGGMRQRTPAPAITTPRRAPRAVSEDDGILIDFDDDE